MRGTGKSRLCDASVGGSLRMAGLALLNPMTWAIDAVRPLILHGWSAAVQPLIIVVIVMAVFDAVCLWIASRAFRKTLG